MDLLLVVLVLFAFGFFFLKKEISHYTLSDTGRPEVLEHASVFQRKTYLFDSSSEYNFFKLLIELFGEQYYIFPQINLSHLVEPRDKTFYEHRKNRSRIEKKSVDFVICDKVRVVPQLVIELDGPTHTWESRVKRDIFVDQLMKDVELPMLRVKTTNVARDFIKAEVQKALTAGQ